MKTLTQYIKEELEITKSRNGDKDYRGVVLIRRKVDGENLSREDFIKFMMEDSDKAVKKYSEIIKPYDEEEFEKHKERVINDAKKYAGYKWKRQSTRDKYLETIKANLENSHFAPSEIKDFLIYTNPVDTGCGLQFSMKEDDDRKEFTLGIAYDEMKSGKWFDKIQGWSFRYDADLKSLRAHYRPYVHFDFDAETQVKLRQRQIEYARGIEDFYKNTEYWGD